MDGAEAGSAAAVLAAFENTPAITWLLHGPEHRIVAANRLARASVGDRPNLLGVPVRQAVPEIAEEDIAELLDAVRASGEPLIGVERRVSVDRNGDGVLVEGFFNVDVLPVTGPDGEKMLLAHVIEVTEVVRQRQQAELAADDARELLMAERRVVLDLQRALLPPGLPVLPDLGLGASYVPAGQWLAAGGDWYDVVVMPDDRVGLVVGDVVGHGATASGVMGQLRAVAAERLTRGCPVGEVLAALDRMAALAVDGRGSTVCVVVLERTTGLLHFATRGHPLPVVVGGNGSTRVLAGPVGPPLGFPESDPSTGRGRIRPGETLLMFSDGAVERPGLSIMEGIAGLCGRVSLAVRGPVDNPRDLAGVVCLAAAGPDGAPATTRDDLSVLAATRLVETAPPLVLRLPGAAEQLGTLHRELGAWLEGLAVSGEDQIAVELAVVEAVTNSIEHGYREHRGTVAVDARVDRSGVLVITVADQGGWREPSGEDGFRGRGLLMMRECCDRLDLDTAATGTIVHMRRLVHTPATGLETKEPMLAAEPAVFTVEDAVGVDGSARLILRGALDTSNADRLRTAIVTATRHGAIRCVLHLDEVTLLASAALRVLFEQEARIRSAAGELVLIASPGTPARAALAVSGLDRGITIQPA